MLKPSQVESGRAVFFRYLANDAWAMLSKDERFKSVTYYIAQFWNDQASDEIHLRAFASVHPEVVASDLGNRWEADRANVGWCHHQPHSRAQERYWFGAAPLLASYCIEGAGQNDEFNQAFTPFTRFRPSSSETHDIDWELLAPVQRNWLWTEWPRTTSIVGDPPLARAGPPTSPYSMSCGQSSTPSAPSW